jgi:hypothetical protein
MYRTLVLFAATLVLAACGDSSPGALAGTWQATGFMPLKTTFRNGEAETMGLIEKVGYAADGKSVIVTYKDGMMKGTAVRFVLVNSTTAQALSMTYQKLDN